MANRDKMIDSLIENYKSKLILLSNYKLAKEVFINMACINCPLKTKNCDITTCYNSSYNFIEESEEEE